MSIVACEKHRPGGSREHVGVLICPDCTQATQRALEAAVVEAALDLTSKTMFSAGEINKLATRCAALRKFRERDGGR